MCVIITSAEYSRRIGFVEWHNMKIFVKNEHMDEPEGRGEHIEEIRASYKCCGCSASFPGGHQVDGLPPAPSVEEMVI